MKEVGMLVVSLRSVNFVHAKKYENIFDMYMFNPFDLLHSYNPSFLICMCFNMVSFRGQKSLGHAQIGLL